MTKKNQLTKEGEFAYYSSSTDRGWKLVKDSKDRSKRVWHLVDTKNNKVLDKKVGHLTIGGNIYTRVREGWRGMQENARRNELALKERIATKKAEGYVYDYGKWVPGPNFEKIQTQLKASKIAENNSKNNASVEEQVVEEKDEKIITPNNNNKVDETKEKKVDNTTEVTEGNNTSGLEGETWTSDQNANANRLNENFDPYVENTGEARTSNVANVGPRERLTARERMRAQNVERFGETHVRDLEQRDLDFQAMKRGEMTKAEFRELNPNSQTAKAWRKKQLKNRKKVKIKK